MNKNSESYIVLNGIKLEFERLVNYGFYNNEKVKNLRETFKNSQPFPHLVIDGLFSPILLNALYSEFDETRWIDWRRAESYLEIKRGSLPASKFGIATQLYFQTIHSSQFISFLKKITEIENIICDPELVNGGLHEIPSGGFFDVHRDFTHHPVLHIQNRLTLITYLNKNWHDSYGGQLELWSRNLDSCVRSILPEFGKTILFAHTPTSYHGHPVPVNTPNGRARRSVAAYYYSPNENMENIKMETRYAPKSINSLRRRSIIKNFIPPIFMNILRKFRNSYLN